MPAVIHKQSQRSRARLSNDSSEPRKLLFASASNCGQLQIARYFWEFYQPKSCQADFASLESNLTDPFLHKSMEPFGIAMRQHEVASVFLLSTRRCVYDAVITLGAQHSYGTLSPFFETLNTLFHQTAIRIVWSIPEPETTCSGATRKMNQALAIRNHIEFEMLQLIRSIEEDSEAFFEAKT